MDRLTELLMEHRADYDEHTDENSDGEFYHYTSFTGCTCGERNGWELSLPFISDEQWHAEHLTKVIRGHLRTRPVVWAGPPSDARLRGERP